MAIPEDIKTYCKHVGKHWVIIAVFTFFAIISIVQSVTQSMIQDYVIPVWVWLLTIFIGFIVSQYLTWKDMKAERDYEQSEKEKIRKYDVIQDTLYKLALHRDTLIKFQNREVKTPVDLGSWKSEFTALRNDIKAILENEISPAEARLYDHIGVFPNYPMPRLTAFDENQHAEYENWRSRSIRDHRHLTSLFIDYGRHKIRTESFMELFKQPDNQLEE